MHYVAIIGDEEHDVDITEVQPELYRLVVNGEVSEIDARALSDSSLSLLINNESYNIETERVQDGSNNVLVRGSVMNVDVVDLRTNRLRKAQESAGGIDGPVAIVTPMPGKVVAVLVEEGQEVLEGQGIVVVEAMKMENELKSPRAGVVTGLIAENGIAVEGGVSLCTIE